ncbi:MAG: hypothetical protein AAFX94_00505 [Myxococcota bacterium]
MSVADLALCAATTARVNLEHRFPGLDSLLLRLATEGAFVAQPVLSAMTGALAATLGFAKTNLLTLIATEFVMAKTVDYGLSRKLRGPGKSSEAFYASFSRAGLDAGLEGDKAYIRSLLGGFSLTNTGYMDLAVGQVLGWELRKAALEHPAVKTLTDTGILREDQIAPLLSKALSFVAHRIIVPDDLESPITVHLLKALREEHLVDVTAKVRKHAFSEKPRFSGAGTIAGHAVSGGVVGLFLGHPQVGLAVGAGDAVLDALFMSAAMDGRVATVSTMKARSVEQGWLGEQQRVQHKLANFYAPAREEIVKAGADLRNIVETNLDAAARRVEGAAEFVGHGIVAAALNEFSRSLLKTSPERSATHNAATALFRYAAVRTATDALHERFYPHERVGEAIAEVIDEAIERAGAKLKNGGALSLAEAIHLDFPELESLRDSANRTVRRQAGRVKSTVKNFKTRNRTT